MKLLLAFWIVISSCSQADNSGSSSFQSAGYIPPKAEEPVEAESDSTYKLSSCESCLQLANRLSMHYFGWQATVERAMNGGKYKIAQDSDLCDIHFFGKLYAKSAASWLFSEHEGRNSVSNKGAEQVMLYCPCECVP